MPGLSKTTAALVDKETKGGISTTACSLVFRRGNLWAGVAVGTQVLFAEGIIATPGYDSF
jgi:hypothetical protein